MKKLRDFSKVFYNDNERLRSGWRVALFLAVYFLILTFVVNVVFAILTALPIGFTADSLLSFTVSHAISAFLAIVFGWLFGRFLEDLPFRALGAAFTKSWFKHLTYGFMIGALTVCFGALIAYLFGGLKFEYNNAGFYAVGLTLTVSLVIFIGGAAFEEAFFRGYIFQTLIRAKLVWFAVLFTSVFFATVHNANPSANYISWINTFLAGIWFAAAYLKTRTLWMPFGLHLAWNWFLGSILGIQVSGLSDIAAAPFLRAAELGPAWLTGGEYGLEGGLAATIVLLISTLLIWFLPFIKPTDEMLNLTSGEIETDLQ